MAQEDKFFKAISKLLYPLGRLRIFLHRIQGHNFLRFLNLKEKISAIAKKLKGVRNDPLCCLGLLSIILFGTLVFIPLAGQGDFSIADEFCFGSDENLPTGSLVVGPKTSQAESPELSLIQKNSLAAICPPVLVNNRVLGQIIGETTEETEIRKEIIEYSVEAGDTLSSIAEKFGISLDTLLWSNDLTKKATIKPGQKLIILPVSGVVHHVKNGDTITNVAKTYKGKVEDIIAFNELSPEGDIFIGDILVIPDGIMPLPSQIPAPTLAPLASSYFICPIALPCRISQGLHWYNAIDFSHGKCGEPILAAAGGQVLRVKYGWNNGAGNYLTILHPNGVVTMYGHLQSILAAPGENVSQGQIIALMGGLPGTPGSGKSTGCHLHFGVQGAKNPFAR